MTRVNSEYIFTYRVDSANTTQQDIDMCERYNHSHVKVIQSFGKNEFGTLYEVETTDGYHFNAYSTELDELPSGVKKRFTYK